MLPPPQDNDDKEISYLVGAAPKGTWQISGGENLIDPYPDQVKGREMSSLVAPPPTVSPVKQNMNELDVLLQDLSNAR